MGYIHDVRKEQDYRTKARRRFGHSLYAAKHTTHITATDLLALLTKFAGHHTATQNSMIAASDTAGLLLHLYNEKRKTTEKNNNLLKELTIESYSEFSDAARRPYDDVLDVDMLRRPPYCATKSHTLHVRYVYVLLASLEI